MQILPHPIFFFLQIQNVIITFTVLFLTFDKLLLNFRLCLKKYFLFAFLFILNSCGVQQKTWSENDWYAYIKTSSEKQEPSKVYEFSDGTIKMHGENIGYLKKLYEF
jgi:hypothetical protein